MKWSVANYVKSMISKTTNGQVLLTLIMAEVELELPLSKTVITKVSSTLSLEMIVSK